MAEKILKTAECVTPKHPDKMCDQISDAILDFCLKQDENSRVAMEVLGGHGKVSIMGELTTKGTITNTDIQYIVSRIVGYNILVDINIVKQSPEIANGVNTGGAGDQGIMTGYACRDNPNMVPNEYYLARNLAQYLFDAYPYDGKTQITVDEDGWIRTVVASFQNVAKEVLLASVKEWLDNQTACDPADMPVIHCNPAGDWQQGGFEADTGLTGRKLMVDNYGPQVAIGGGCFSGKDSTKVDRSGAYMARKIAVDLLKLTEHVDEVIVKLAYAIGVAQPVMAIAELRAHAGGEVKTRTIDILAEWSETYDLTPAGIISFLELKRPQFENTAQWGHFGNGFKWDR